MEEKAHDDGYEITVTHNDGRSRTTVKGVNREECLRALSAAGVLPAPSPAPPAKPK